jgi:Stress responsive A/B Barrel Domain.
LTHAFVVQFENHNDRDYYVQHDPVHKAFKKEIEPIIEKVTVLDFINGEF